VGRRGLRQEDQLWKFGFNPRVLSSVNQYKNILGTYPKGWRVPLVYRHENKDTEVLVRLMGWQRQQVGGPKPRPGIRPRPMPAQQPSPAAKLFQARSGFANYYFNKVERDRLLADFRKHGDFSKLTGDWTVSADGKIKEQSSGETARFSLLEVKDKKGKGTHSVVKMKMGDTDYEVEPLK